MVLDVVIIAGAVGLGALLVAEIVLRIGFGMGDPPLWIDDPDIEYRARPSMTYRRYGNHVSYNAYSMRNRDVTPTKQDPHEIRVMILGDSIVDGGATLDQEALATSMLERRLATALERPVFVGDIAARGWSPCHYSAYVRKFGLFEADVVLIVINSGDYDQVPAFRRSRERGKPLLALEDLRREIVRKRQIASDGRRFRPDAATRRKNIETCMSALRQVIEAARSIGATVLMAQYNWRSELEGEREEGYHEIGRMAREMGIEPLQIGDAFAAAMREGRMPFLRDARHPNELGQRIMADVLDEPLRKAILARGG